jgi:hypothetical protein
MNAMFLRWAEAKAALLAYNHGKKPDEVTNNVQEVSGDDARSPVGPELNATAREEAIQELGDTGVRSELPAWSTGIERSELPG